MNTLREKIGYRKRGDVYELAHFLKHGGLAVVRTDTVYGILTPAFEEEAVERIYYVKGRDSSKPFIILISSIQMLKMFPVELSSRALRFLEKEYDEAVSVVFPVRKDTLSQFEYLHRGRGTLAFRIPRDVYLRELISLTGPLVAPSANPEGMAPARSIQEAIEYFGDMLSFYEDGGMCDDASVSRIVSFLEGEEGKCLR